MYAGETQKKEEKLYRLRPTHDDLQARQAEARASRPEKNANANEGAKPAVGKKREGPGKSSLIKRSAVLSSTRNWTIVPKGAVLHIPAQYQKQVNGKQVGKLIPWKEFYAQNRGWIHVHSVSMDQARGKKNEPEAGGGLSKLEPRGCFGLPWRSDFHREARERGRRERSCCCSSWEQVGTGLRPVLVYRHRV